MYAQEFLEKKQVELAEVVDARKEKIDDGAAWALLNEASTITIAKGKKVQRFTPADGREAVLKQAMGPSGNLRAPTYRVGDQFVIGFNAELYEDWAG